MIVWEVCGIFLIFLLRVSSLRRPRSHEGEFDPLSTRATLPARIRNAEPGSSFPISDPAKRRKILCNFGAVG